MLNGTLWVPFILLLSLELRLKKQAPNNKRELAPQ